MAEQQQDLVSRILSEAAEPMTQGEFIQAGGDAKEYRTGYLPRLRRSAPVSAVRRLYDAYQRSIGGPFERNVALPAEQMVSHGIRGFVGLPMRKDVTDLGREAYRTGETIGFMPGPNAPAGALRAVAEFVPQAAMFIGAAAKTWNRASHAKALEMEKAGAAPQEIWRQTGNWKGPDGMWRQEISDKDVKFVGSEATAPANVVMPHEQLAAAYPDVMQTPVTLRPRQTTSTTTSNEAGARIDLGTYGKEKPSLLGLWGIETGPKSPLLHELQHVIQRKEGFGRGGSPDTVRIDNPYPPQLTPLWNEYSELYSSLKGQTRPKSPVGMTMRTVDIEDWFYSLDEVTNPTVREKFLDILNRIKAERQKLFGKDQGPWAEESNIEAYRRLAGEAEARATQRRIMMTEEQRRAKFPPESYDVPLDELVIKRD